MPGSGGLQGAALEGAAERLKLKQRLKFLGGHARLADDGVHGSTLHVSGVNRNGGHAFAGLVPEMQVTASLVMFDEAGALQGCDDLAGFESGELAHATAGRLTRTVASDAVVGCCSMGIG